MADILYCLTCLSTNTQATLFPGSLCFYCAPRDHLWAICGHRT
jgi:hypothetical protein